MGILRRLFGRKYAPSWEMTPEPLGNGTADENVGGQGFYTSTATVVVYDLEALKHRVDDDVDWWADPKAELEEINQRNVLIVGLKFDGFYDLDIAEEEPLGQSYSLRFPSGRVFIGPGEVLTGGGDEPDENSEGKFLDLPPGDYKVGVIRTDEKLRIALIRTDAFKNALTEPITA